MEIYRGGIRECFCKWLGQRAGLAVAAAISGFVLLAPLALFAAEEEIIFRGQSVFVEGADVGTPCASLCQPEGRLVARTLWVSRKEGAEWAHGERRCACMP